MNIPYGDGYEFKQKMSSFDIQINDLSYTEIEETPKLSVWDVISNIGGNLGLFLGMSFISLAEVIHLCVELIQIVYEFKIKKKIFKN